MFCLIHFGSRTDRFNINFENIQKIFFILFSMKDDYVQAIK